MVRIYPCQLWYHLTAPSAGPATQLLNPPHCAVPSPGFPSIPQRTAENNPAGPENEAGCVYEDDLFNLQVLNIIEHHDSSRPLFLFWAPHVIHGPLQVPQDYLKRFRHVDDWRRQRYLAMTSFLDESIGNVTRLLKQRDMWTNTLMVVASDKCCASVAVALLLWALGYGCTWLWLHMAGIVAVALHVAAGALTGCAVEAQFMVEEIAVPIITRCEGEYCRLDKGTGWYAMACSGVSVTLLDCRSCVHHKDHYFLIDCCS